MPINIILVYGVKYVAIITGLYYFRRLSVPFRIIWAQILIALTIEYIGRYINLQLHQSNLWIFNIYILLEFALLCYAGWLLMQTGKIRKFFPFVASGLTISWFYQLYAYPINDRLYNWPMVLFSMLMVFVYINILFTRAIYSSNSLSRQPLLFISIAHVVYFACVIPLFGLFNHTIEVDVKMADNIFLINLVVNIIRYLLVALAFYLYGKQAKSAYVRQ